MVETFRFKLSSANVLSLTGMRLPWSLMTRLYFISKTCQTFIKQILGVYNESRHLIIAVEDSEVRKQAVVKIFLFVFYLAVSP